MHQTIGALFDQFLVASENIGEVPTELRGGCEEGVTRLRVVQFRPAGSPGAASVKRYRVHTDTDHISNTPWAVGPANRFHISHSSMLKGRTL